MCAALIENALQSRVGMITIPACHVGRAAQVPSSEVWFQEALPRRSSGELQKVLSSLQSQLCFVSGVFSFVTSSFAIVNFFRALIQVGDGTARALCVGGRSECLSADVKAAVFVSAFLVYSCLSQNTRAQEVALEQRELHSSTHLARSPSPFSSSCSL